MTDDELRFVEAIQRNPDDDDTRMVYADWLEQQGDPRGEYLRLEIAMHRLPERLGALARQIDPTWRDLVARRYRVILVQSSLAIQTIKVIRSVTNLGLKDAKDLYDARPSAIVRDVSREVAERIATAFDTVAEIAIEPDVTPLRERITPPPAPMIPEAWSVRIVSVLEGRRIGAIKALRSVDALLGTVHARDVIDGVIAGKPHVLRTHADPATARHLVAAFEGVAVVEAIRVP